MPNDSTRRNITETSEWTPGIYQLEENDVAEAGPDGILNQPIKDLAARTNYLKKLITELQPTVPGAEKYDELLEKINALDAAKENNRINHLERLVANAYLAFDMAKIDPDGYDGMVIETFDDGAKETDQSVTTVTSVVSGDDSIDVEDASGLLIGAHYQLTDGEHLEEVQVKSIAVSGKINRIKLESVVKNQYSEGRAKLRRSSVAIYNGRAYGGGNRRTDTWDDTGDSWSGTNTQQDVSAQIDYTDVSSFTISGAVLENGKLVLGDKPVGIALVSTGGGSGTWARIDEEGDDAE